MAMPAPSRGDDLGRALTATFYGLVQRMKQDSARRAAEWDMSVAQVRALYALREPLSMRELAERLYLDPSNLTALVDRLEELGLVERRADADDRRVKRLVITEGRAPRRSDHRCGLRQDRAVRRARHARTAPAARPPHPSRRRADAVALALHPRASVARGSSVRPERQMLDGGVWLRDAVPGVGLEPTCPCGQSVLSRSRQPIAPSGRATTLPE